MESVFRWYSYAELYVRALCPLYKSTMVEKEDILEEADGIFPSLAVILLTNILVGLWCETVQIKEIVWGLLPLAIESHFQWNVWLLRIQALCNCETPKEVMNHKLLPLDI